MEYVVQEIISLLSGKNRKGMKGKIMPEVIFEFATTSKYEPVLGFKLDQQSTSNPVITVCSLISIAELASYLHK